MKSRWAYIGMALGGLASILANVAHATLPTDPPAGSVIAAALWPIFLFVAIEILAKHAWPSGWEWIAVRTFGLVPVAVVSAVVSYRHMSGLLAAWGEDGLTAAIGPIAVDGLLVMSTGAIIAAGRAVRAPAPVPIQAPKPVAPEPKPQPVQAPKPAPAASNGKAQVVSDEALLAVVRPLMEDGKGRPAIEEALKDKGLPCGTRRLQNLMSSLKEPALVS